MRFLYGLILGVLATVIGSILYLAFTGGDYLLLLSPKYQGLASAMDSCKQAVEQRNQLTVRLEAVERSFEKLSQRFNELQSSHPDLHAPGGADSSPKPAEAPNP